MGAPVVWWEINTGNAARLQEFYTKLFGWEVNANNPMQYGVVSTGNKKGIAGGIGQNDPAMPPPPAVTFYVEVEDLQEMLNKAVGIGATIVMPVTEIPNMVTMAMFRDPEGNVIGMIKSQPPPKPKRVARKKAAKKPAKKAKAARRLRRK